MLRLWKRLLAYASCALLLAVLCTGCGTDKPAGVPSLLYRYPDQAVLPFSGQYEPAAQVPGMDFVAQKGFVAMYADLATGNIAVEDMRTHQVFYSSPPTAENDDIAFGTYKARLYSPLMTSDVVESDGVVKTKNSYESCYEQGGIAAKATKDGVQVWFKFMEERYAIPVEYTLCEDGFRVRVLCDQIVEQGDSRLFSVSLMPFFGAQPGTEEGYLLVPDGSGALIRFSSRKESYAAYTSRLYGDDYLTVEDYKANEQENSLLPMIGLQTANGGFLAVADNGAACGNVYAGVDGQLTGHNNVYFNFDLRKRQTALIGNAQAFNAKTVSVYEPGDIAVGDISVRYILLDSDTQDGLTKMAAAARGYMTQEAAGANVRKLDNPFYISTLGGYRKKTSVLGVRAETTVPVSTFAETQEMQKRLEALGLQDAAWLYSGYDNSALKGKISDSLTLDGAVGNRKTLASLVNALGKSRLFLSVNPVVFRETSNAARIQSDAIRDLSLNKYTLLTYKRNTFHPDSEVSDAYLLKCNLAAAALRGVTADIRSLSSDAGLLVNGLGSMLYGDYTQGGYSRNHAAQTIAQTFRELSEGGAVMADNANYYAALYASAVVNVPFSSSGYDILDESVPFYQMVMSNGRQLISRPINSYGDSELAFLECVRFGMVPHYELVMTEPGTLKESGLNTFYAADFETWGAVAAQKYAIYLPLFERIGGEAITGYRWLSEYVTETAYANGVRVLVNTGDADETADGQTVPAGGFTLIG